MSATNVHSEAELRAALAEDGSAYIAKGFGLDAPIDLAAILTAKGQDNGDFAIDGPGAIKNMLFRGHSDPMFYVGRNDVNARVIVGGISIHGMRDQFPAPSPVFDVSHSFISLWNGTSVFHNAGAAWRLSAENQCHTFNCCQAHESGGPAFDLEKTSDIKIIGGNYERCTTLLRWTGTSDFSYRSALILGPHIEVMKESVVDLHDIQGLTWLGGYVYLCDFNLDAACFGNTIRGVTLVNAEVNADFSTNDVDMCIKIGEYGQGKPTLWRPSHYLNNGAVIAAAKTQSLWERALALMPKFR